MRGLLQRQFGGLPRAFWVLWVATLVNRAGGFVGILLAIYLTQERGFNAATVGIAVGLIGGGNALGALIGGHLSDAWGRRGVLLIGHVTSAVAMIALAFADTPALIIAIAAALGVAQGLPRPAFAAMVIDIVRPGDRLRALNLNYWILNIGFTIAALLGGVLASYDFTLIFVLDAIATLTAGLLVWALVAETRPERQEQTGDDSQGVNPYRDPVFLGLLLFMLLMGLVFGQTNSTMPIAMVDQGIGPEAYGAVIGINGVMIIAGQLFMPRLTRGFDHSILLALSAVIMGAGYGVFAFAHSVSAFAAGIVVITVGEMLMTPPLQATAAEVSPLHGRGRYQGAMALSGGLASFAAPVIGGFAYQAHPSLLWGGVFAVSVVAALMTVSMRQALRRRVAELATSRR